MALETDGENRREGIVAVARPSTPSTADAVTSGQRDPISTSKLIR